MSKILFAENLEQLNSISEQILKHTFPYKKFAFYGEMGVGKTTLIKALSLHLGVTDMVSSPTFSIVNEYRINESEKIYHFDFFRTEDEQEVYDMGYEEYFLSNAYCFVEWPEKITNLIEEDMVRVKMSTEGTTRRIEVIL
ncbi:MAG TPA: tRNA (adenosine(37)-N6)-threonylcarbamoyltransferase complex ATPase subunit type 1 TsaE [Flavobacteriales bacterium]|jgi:tRNA threonylcarbamoyladenosine biosynthesis protein TsaE|nr:tRNA (adenosine(37)-N6)-threonylcarbamoyltransferase complex ATPase subunit type 1 TsaE [Flavobacteriales bacterium]